MRQGSPHFIRRAWVIITILALLLALVITAPVSAATNRTEKCDPIASGLWAGVNLILDTNFGCKEKSANKNRTNQPNSTPKQPQKPQPSRYVALGDSVAAGIGLSPRTAGTDPACGTTNQAYPVRVANQLNIPHQNLACSGATAGDLVSEQHLSVTSRDIDPQLNQAFANGKPSLISVTAGANDTQWDAFLRKCYASECGTEADKAITTGLLTALELKLRYILNDINLRSNGKPPRVIFTGYYQPFANACAQQQTNVTRGELGWLSSQTRALNETIQDVVNDYSFARFAPVNFGGHELCSSEPWVQGVHAAAPFHPTARGQQAIANAVISQAR